MNFTVCVCDTNNHLHFSTFRSKTFLQVRAFWNTLLIQAYCKCSAETTFSWLQAQLEKSWPIFYKVSWMHYCHLSSMHAFFFNKEYLQKGVLKTWMWTKKTKIDLLPNFQVTNLNEMVTVNINMPYHMINPITWMSYKTNAIISANCISMRHHKELALH